ncbi:hypothetical protein BOTCAL_0084g00020 [Botryotinia calthae]|uniref:Uncharacterized protein n=1 Tax=Botryotinia calthae TaxID=38488 RepID=A0A4Y8D9Z7_9HELO|nr:hypothetical protein BOTCAL_0084g00020 [Botryotinia calthae]
MTSASLDEAGEIVAQAIVNKLVKSLSIMQDYTSIDRNKPLNRGIGLLKEFMAEIAVLETQGWWLEGLRLRMISGQFGAMEKRIE